MKTYTVTAEQLDRAKYILAVRATVLTIEPLGQADSKYFAELSCGHGQMRMSRAKVGGKTWCDMSHVELKDGTYVPADDLRNGYVDPLLIATDPL